MLTRLFRQPMLTTRGRAWYWRRRRQARRSTRWPGSPPS